MNFKELIEKHEKVLNLVFRRNIKDAIDMLSEMLQHCRNIDFKVRLEEQVFTYSNMLKYSFELADDPQKEQVHSHLQKQIVELADDIKEDIITNNNMLRIYARKLQQTKELELPRNGSFSDFFNSLFIIDKLTDSDIRKLNLVCSLEDIMWYDKCLVVSALSLSLFRHFDENKFSLLIDFFEKNEEQVWHRALAGIIIALIIHNRRMHLCPLIKSRLSLLNDDKRIKDYTEPLLMKFILAQDTERINKKIQDEIVPEVMKIRSKLEDKLDLNNIVPSDKFDDINPDWEEFFKDSPELLDKFEELTNLQKEGADVFHGAFAMLKQFPFFNDMSNWFLPFYKEHSVVEPLADIQSDKINVSTLIENIENTTVMCNSDKYSLCFNLERTLAAQNANMIKLLSSEISGMSDMTKEDDIINISAKHKMIFSQYLQDLYRFYKVFPLRNEIDDVFMADINLAQNTMLKDMLGSIEPMKRIGGFYFKSERSSEAAEIFEYLIQKSPSADLYEKTAFCFQKERNYRKALEYYHKAELAGDTSVWLLKKIAYCCRNINDSGQAIKYFLEAEKSEPDNLSVQLSLGHTYMDIDNYEKALKYYFKVEYLSPHNYKVHRPIAWCSFVLGKLENAKKYFVKVIEKDANEHDYMNMGHVEWAMGNRQPAIDCYIKAMQKSSNNIKWFAKTFEADSKYLLKNNISPLDISLMLDYIKLKVLPVSGNDQNVPRD